MVLRLPGFAKEYWADPEVLARWTPTQQAAKLGKSQYYESVVWSTPAGNAKGTGLYLPGKYHHKK